jgi:hypothetical protein
MCVLGDEIVDGLGVEPQQVIPGQAESADG